MSHTVCHHKDHENVHPGRIDPCEQAGCGKTFKMHKGYGGVINPNIKG